MKKVKMGKKSISINQSVQLKRGVEKHHKKNIKNYEELVHPPLNIRKTIAEELMKVLFNEIKTNWNIFEPGIGGGWLTFNLLKILERLGNNGKIRINLIGVDTCKQMLIYFLKFFNKNISFRYTCTFNLNSNINIELINKEAISFCKNISNQKFNIIFCFFLFHHLNNWQKGLEILTQLLEKDGLIVISEIGGDQSVWSASFDKLDINITGSKKLKGRLNYINFVKIFQSYCEKIGWYNYLPITASDVKPALDWLEKNGFIHIYTITKTYKKEITLRKWLTAGGIIPIINKGNKGRSIYDRSFSVFPIFKKDTERSKFYASLKKESKKNGIKINEKIEIQDELKYYIYKKCN